MVTWGLVPLGALPAGVLAEAYGAPLTVFLGGAITCVFVVGLLDLRDPGCARRPRWQPAWPPGPSGSRARGPRAERPGPGGSGQSDAQPVGPGRRDAPPGAVGRALLAQVVERLLPVAGVQGDRRRPGAGAGRAPRWAGRSAPDAARARSSTTPRPASPSGMRAPAERLLVALGGELRIGDQDRDADQLLPAGGVRGERADALDLGQAGFVAASPTRSGRASAGHGPASAPAGHGAGRGGGRPEAAITAGDWVRGDDFGATTSERQRSDVPSGVTRSPRSISPWGTPAASMRRHPRRRDSPPPRRRSADSRRRWRSTP